MERSRYRILAAVRDAGGDVEFCGADAVAAVELERRGLLVRRKPDAFGDDESVFVCKGLTPSGYAALDEREGRFGRGLGRFMGGILGELVRAAIWAAVGFAVARLFGKLAASELPPDEEVDNREAVSQELFCELLHGGLLPLRAPSGFRGRRVCFTFSARRGLFHLVCQKINKQVRCVFSGTPGQELCHGGGNQI